MKRILTVLVLCSVLMTFAVIPVLSVQAEEWDLAALSDADLTQLLTRVNEEIVSRGLEKTAELRKGSYIAGKDIPCGTYIFTCMARGNDWGNVTVYAQKGNGKQILWEIVSAPDEGEEQESFMITLEEDDQLESQVPFSLTVFKGIVFR